MYDALQYGQKSTLKCAVYILRKKDYNFSAKLLEHSLEENP